ncbi:MAG: FMN-binding protein [Phycisphaerae bacterium]|jgi:Na+-transporting NADH:ubiquinone oxidoreductase subunit C|nr:FMN-binding protein [Phycisphaerae bacterium]
MKSNFYTIAYAAVLGLVCATALTAVHALTEEAYKNNKAAKKARDIMMVLDIPFDANASAKEIVEIQERKVNEDKTLAGTLGVTGVYSSGEAEKRLWAIEFEGEGMWKPIKGLLCLKNDMKTIHGVTFYEQEETPGLGARITEPLFMDGFRGKTIYDSSGEARIRIMPKGTHSGNNEIDAVSGASITSGKVEDMLNELIEKIDRARDAGKLPEVPDGR